MNRIIALLLLLAGTIQAQTFTLTPIGDTNKQGPPDTEIHFLLEVKNTTNRTQESWVIKNPLRLPAGWESVICVGGFCYEPSRDSVTLSLAPGQADTIKFNITPTNTLDSAQYDLRVELKLNAADGGTVRYVAKTTSQVSREKLQTVNITTFPNPVQDQLFIQTEGFSSAAFEITDLTGRICQKGTWNTANQAISVNQLNSGMYIIRLTNDTNQASYTFIKQ